MYPYNSLLPIKYSSYPFSHFQITQLFGNEVQNELLNWLENEAPWNYQERSFYRQMACDVLASPLHLECSVIGKPESLRYLRGIIESVFEVEIAEGVTLHAHKLLTGYEIGIHTDAPKLGKETHRLVVTFHAPDRPSKGGELVFFEHDSSENPSVKYPVQNNAGIGFALTKSSYHAVTPVEEGIRYSLIYSLWTKGHRGK